MRIRFIINPCSGGQRGAAFQPVIARWGTAHSLTFDIVLTGGPGHATELAQDAVARGFSHVACVGGDGTVNEVARALVDTPAVLLILPHGSGNGLARHLGLPATVPAGLPLLLPETGRVTAIDTGSANGRFFCNVMGLGFDATIAGHFNAMTSRGLRGYVRTALRAFTDRRPEMYTIRAGGQSWQQSALLVAVANSDQYGNNFRIAPGASVTDGRLDLVTIAPLGARNALALLARILAGRPERSAEYRRVQGSEFTIQRTAPGQLHTDGEVQSATSEISVQVRPRSLRVLVPRAGPP